MARIFTGPSMGKNSVTSTLRSAVPVTQPTGQPSAAEKVPLSHWVELIGVPPANAKGDPGSVSAASIGPFEASPGGIADVSASWEAHPARRTDARTRRV